MQTCVLRGKIDRCRFSCPRVCWGASPLDQGPGPSSPSQVPSATADHLPIRSPAAMSRDAIGMLGRNIHEIPYLIRTSPGRSHTEPGASRLFGSHSCLVYFINIHQLRRFYRCFVVTRLTAVSAIFRTPASLDAEQRTSLHHLWVVHQPANRASSYVVTSEGASLHHGRSIARPDKADDRLRQLWY